MTQKALQEKFEHAFKALGFDAPGTDLVVGEYGLIKLDGQAPVAAAWLFPDPGPKLLVRAIASPTGVKEKSFSLVGKTEEEIADTLCNAMDFYLETTSTLSHECIESAYPALGISPHDRGPQRQCDRTLYTDKPFALQPRIARQALCKALNLTPAEVEYLDLAHSIPIKAKTTDTRGLPYLNACTHRESIIDTAYPSLSEKLATDGFNLMPYQNPTMETMIAAIDRYPRWADQKLFELGVRRYALSNQETEGKILQDFYEEALANENIPAKLAEISKTFCRTAGIRGICDPVYVCNVIAFETQAGDGCGEYHPREDLDYAMSHISNALTRLESSYHSSMKEAGITPAMLRALLEEPMREFLKDHYAQRQSNRMRTVA